MENEIKEKVKSCNVKTKKDNFTIYTVQLENHEDKYFDVFEQLEVGKEYTFEVNKNENPNYNDKLKVKRERKWAAQDHSFNKKKVALECATRLGVANNAQSKDVVGIANFFYENFLK